MSVRPWASWSLGRLSMLPFLGAGLWFGTWWLLFSKARVNWSAEDEAALIVLGSGVTTCVGFAFGVVGLLPENRNRLSAALGVILNGAGLAYVSQHLLVGL